MKIVLEYALTNKGHDNIRTTVYNISNNTVEELNMSIKDACEQVYLKYLKNSFFKTIYVARRGYGLVYSDTFKSLYNISVKEMKHIKDFK